jgi:hypothetical protein
MLSELVHVVIGRSQAQKSIMRLRRLSRSPTEIAPESRTEPERAAPKVESWI